MELNWEVSLKCAEQVKSHRLRSVAALYKVQQDFRSARLIGTGTYIRHRGQIFILTALHVMDTANDSSWKVMHGAAASAGDGVPLQMEPCPVWVGSNPDFDLAVVACVSKIAGRTVQPLEIDEFTDFKTPTETEVIFACGWPGVIATPLPFIAEYRTQLLSVIGQVQNEDGIPDQSFTFGCPEFTDYSGMSGSAAWNLNVHLLAQDELWKPEMSELAGIVTQWNFAKGYLIATGAKALNTFLMRAFEKIRATPTFIQMCNQETA